MNILEYLLVNNSRNDQLKKNNDESIRLKIQLVSLPTITIFVISTIVIMGMFWLSYTDEDFGLAKYQSWFLLGIFFPFLSLIHLHKYTPDQKLKKFQHHRFIADHIIMKYGLFVILFFMVLFFILTEFEKPLNLSQEMSDFLLYSVIYFLFIIWPTRKMYSYASKLDAAFIFSKAYCMKFENKETKLDKISSLNQTLKKYNLYLEQRFGFFIDNRLDIVQKYITDKDTFDFLNTNLLSSFETNDQGKPMELIFDKFHTNKTILKDNNLLDKFKNNASVFAILVTISIFLITILPNLITYFLENNG